MPAAFPCSKILVPLDFSDDSKRALHYAVALAKSTGAEVSLLTVIEDTFPYPELFAWDHPDEEFYKFMRTEARKRMAGLVADSGLEADVDRLVVRGRPMVEIVAMADEVGADLIVMAKHGSSGIRAAIMGSTAESVIRNAHCPVLVLPAAVESDSGSG